MRHRLAALTAVAWFVASCGGSASPSVTGAQTSAPVTFTPITAPPTSSTITAPPSAAPSTAPASATPVTSPATPPPSSDAAACRLSDPVAVTAPARLMSLSGSVTGVTDRGELIVSQSHVVIVTDTLSLLDPRTGKVTSVVARPVPKSAEAATSQIGGATGNADWVVWEEVGFYLEHADWRMWAMDRRTGKIREVAAFDPGPDGLAAPGWASDVSLLGDIATWSAPAMLGPNTAGERIYVADLRTKTVRRLDAEAQWPSLMSASQLVAAMQVGTDPGSGQVLAQPTTITLANGTATPQDWMDPVRVLAYAASGSGSVAVRLLKEATAEDSVRVADVITRDARGTVRTFTLPNGSGPVVAGTGFLAWTDQRHLWILPSGQAQPTMLLATEDDSTQVQVFANGTTVFWRTVGFDYSWTTNRMASVICP